MIVESYEDVIILSGALRSNFWDTIHTAISLTLKRHPSGVIIDCSGLTEATAQGAETFRDAMEFINSHDARIIVASVSAPVMEVLKTVPEVRSQLPIAQSVEAARRSLDLLLKDEEHGAKSKKKKPTLENARKLIVCLYTGTTVEEDDAAMQVALRIADSQPTEVHLVCALIVPRNLPLQAPLDKNELSAQSAIHRAEQFFSVRDVVHVSRIERARDVASALLEVTSEVPTDWIVLPLMNGSMKQDESLSIVGSVLGRVQGEVIFVRGK